MDGDHIQKFLRMLFTQFQPTTFASNNSYTNTEHNTFSVIMKKSEKI